MVGRIFILIKQKRQVQRLYCMTDLSFSMTKHRADRKEKVSLAKKGYLEWRDWVANGNFNIVTFVL